MIRVLVFPCGSEIGLEVHRSLSQQKDIELFGASSVEDHGSFVYKNYIKDIPNIYEKEFPECIKRIIIEYNINYIYPCLDIVLHALKKIEDFIGCTVLTSEFNTTDICLSKLKTYNFFKNIIRTPTVFSTFLNLTYPVFSKPAIGSSSRNTFKISSSEELEINLSHHPNNLILEYLPGEEYTVDCFTSKSGELKYIGPRKRARISNGISVKTYCTNEPGIEEIAHKINNNLSFSGPWFFQLKKDQKENFCLLEIACRFAGSSVIHRMNGINFAYLNILNEMTGDVEILSNNLSIEIDRSFDVKCKTNINFDRVYVDLDDTLIIKDKININLIRFLYEMLNRNKKIFLLTKHKDNVEDTLLKFKIDKNIFDSIIHIDKKDSKSSYIENKSVFIDDSFSERKDVFKNCNISVFSVDAIDALL